MWYIASKIKVFSYSGREIWVISKKTRKDTSVPTYPGPRLAVSGQRVSFADGRNILEPMGLGITHATGGHPATRVPIGPPQVFMRPPMVSPSIKTLGSIGGTSKSKTRPSHFQKWVTKFSGSGDPYDHLALFNQVARAEEVTDLHVVRE